MTSTLIKELEAADGPSEALDVAIWKTHALPESFFGAKVTAQRFHGRTVDYETDDGFYHTNVATVPCFTASIDAALTVFEDETHALQTLLRTADYLSMEEMFGKHPTKLEVIKHFLIAALRALANEGERDA